MERARGDNPKSQIARLSQHHDGDAGGVPGTDTAAGPFNYGGGSAVAATGPFNCDGEGTDAATGPLDYDRRGSVPAKMLQIDLA